jgi:hypothetical protein
MTIVATLLLSVLILFFLFLVLAKIKTPYYRIDLQQMIHVIEMVLTGQATDNNWQMTFGMTIRHAPELEIVRQRCLVIEEAHFMGNHTLPYLFSEQGLSQLRDVLAELRVLQLVAED